MGISFCGDCYMCAYANEEKKIQLFPLKPLTFRLNSILENITKVPALSQFVHRHPEPGLTSGNNLI